MAKPKAARTAHPSRTVRCGAPSSKAGSRARQFHPELKGLPDEKREGQDRIWRCVSMGAGEALADAFFAQSYRLLFGQQVPTIQRAKLVVAWTVKHVVRYNPGLVGGELQLAVLEKDGGGHGKRVTRIPGETEGQVDALEKYISEFVEKQEEPDAAADASPIDIQERLKPSGG